MRGRRCCLVDINKAATAPFSYDNRGNRLTETVTADDSYVITREYDVNGNNVSIEDVIIIAHG